MKYYEIFFSIDAPLELLQPAREVVCAIAGDVCFESFQDVDGGVTGFVQQQLFSRDALDDALACFPLPQCTVTYDVREAEYRDWNEQWEQEGFQPICLHMPEGREWSSLVVHDGRHIPQHDEGLQNTVSTSPRLTIEIDARQAFGTGTHETTRMMLATLVEQPLQGLRVLDCGTGTGILAIAALKLGASEAVGYDIDEWSTDNARHNAVINRVDQHFTPLLGDVSILKEVEGSFDIVLANINRNILLADMEDMTAKMKPGALLALSGFLISDTDMLLSKAAECGLCLTGRREDNGWSCLLLQTKTNDTTTA